MDQKWVKFLNFGPCILGLLGDNRNLVLFGCSLILFWQRLYWGVFLDFKLFQFQVDLVLKDQFLFFVQ